MVDLVVALSLRSAKKPTKDVGMSLHCTQPNRTYLIAHQECKTLRNLYVWSFVSYKVCCCVCCN